MKTLFKAALWLVTGMTTPALAAEHEVIILPQTYFPETIHAEPGDTIRFVNGTGESTSVAALDGSWASDPIDIGGVATVLVAEGMTKGYTEAHLATADVGVTATTSESASGPVGYIEWELPAMSFNSTFGD